MPDPKIYCFVNAGAGTDWQTVMAMSEGGDVLATHISSSLEFAQMDIGYALPPAAVSAPHRDKHAVYAARFPDGYELVWVADPLRHEGLMAAYALNQEKGRAAVAAADEEAAVR